MKIGIIGAGKIGMALAGHIARAGHEVMICNSREPETLRPLLTKTGERISAATCEQVARCGEVVFLALPWRRKEELPAGALGPPTIVVDAMNPYRADMSLEDTGPRTSSEVVRDALPDGTRVVKAFNTVWHEHLVSQARDDLPAAERRAVPVAGDDPEAKAIVMKLVEEMGFGPVDTGGLAEGGRRQAPGSDLYNKDMTAAEAAALSGGGGHPRAA